MLHATIDTTKVDLSSRAMLVSLSVGTWTARKLDKRITQEINTAHGAAADAGRYNKSLIAKDALAEIQTIVGAARNDQLRLTLPWQHGGTGILTVDGFDNWADTMRRHREAFEQARADFLAVYPDLIEQARIRLNGLFNAADYPDPADLARRFYWETRVTPIPTAADFRVDLGAQQTARIQADIEAQMNSAVKDAMDNGARRMLDAVRKMSDKLAAFKPAEKTGDKTQGIFRDSLVENIRDLCDILPTLNLTADPEFARLIEQARDGLTKSDADALRNDPDARKETQKAAADIADAMASFMGG